MADGAWSYSTCRGDVQWYGVPGQGCWYYTQRFGMHFVGGIMYQVFKAYGYECGVFGPPVKDYQWLSEFSRNGIWFEGGAITDDGYVHIGNYGQTAGR